MSPYVDSALLTYFRSDTCGVNIQEAEIYHESMKVVQESHITRSGRWNARQQGLTGQLIIDHGLVGAYNVQFSQLPIRLSIEFEQSIRNRI